MVPILQSAGFVLLGLLPSLIWLAFYYREDCHPEPKYLLARTFLIGIIVAPIAVIGQLGFVEIISKASEIPKNVVGASPQFFLWAALIEEVVKFLAVYFAVIRRPEFDEPIDAMVYMITAALGFAAIENILIIFQTVPAGAASAISTLILRFIGATLLHALASGIMGYFLALSWFHQYHAKKLIIVGIAISTMFHFAFNLTLSTLDNQGQALLYTTFLLLAMALLISTLFDRVKHRRTELPVNFTSKKDLL